MRENPEIDVAHAAKLARLNLTAEETQLFQMQLDRVLEYAGMLRSLNTDSLEPAAHADPLFNVFREDEVRESLTAEEALGNAPQQANGLFIVTKVLE